ncbi:MAG TPA: hypothetical protein VG269_04725 [Tepidisphaeraceae bacterium]|jgi:hypothetical protein|nr:hypothetical protein [Tepidisphaeraceae bacterium]
MLRVPSRLLAGVALAALPAAAVAGTTFQTTLTPVNGSTVTGTAQFSLSGDQLTFSLQAQGLTPGEFHPEHIHGFLNPVMPSVLPTLANSDVNGNGITEDIEAERVAGQELVYLTAHPSGTDFGNTFSDYPVADASGRINFTQTYTLPVPQLVQPLNIRSFELHGEVINGAYDPTIPVAGGLITAGTSGGGTGAGGTTAVPLPSAAPAGLMLGGLLGAGMLLRRRRYSA